MILCLLLLNETFASLLLAHHDDAMIMDKRFTG